MYNLKPSKFFAKQYKKIIKNNIVLEKRIDVALTKLTNNPESVSHKVDEFWSCRVTGDVRIIWEYQNGEPCLLLLKIGGHPGTNKVYK